MQKLVKNTRIAKNLRQSKRNSVSLLVLVIDNSPTSFRCASFHFESTRSIVTRSLAFFFLILFFKCRKIEIFHKNSVVHFSEIQLHIDLKRNDRSMYVVIWSRNCIIHLGQPFAIHQLIKDQDTQAVSAIVSVTCSERCKWWKI